MKRNKIIKRKSKIQLGRIIELNILKQTSINEHILTQNISNLCSIIFFYKTSHGTVHIHTHSFNDHFSGTTRVSWYQNGKTNLDFTEAIVLM